MPTMPTAHTSLFSPFEYSGEDTAGRFFLGMLVAFELWQLPVMVPTLLSLSANPAPSFALDVLLTSNDARHGTAFLLSLLAWAAYVPWLVLRRARALGLFGSVVAGLLPASVTVHTAMLQTAAGASAQGVPPLAAGWTPLAIWASFLAFALPPARTFATEVTLLWSLRWATAALLSLCAVSVAGLGLMRILGG